MKALGRFALAAGAIASITFVSALRAGAAEITIPPNHDNSLFGDDGTRSCGIGPLFSGQANGFGPRRIVISFDVAGSLPAGSTVTSVELGLTVQNAGPSSNPNDLYRLRRLTADWGEGISECSVGTGAPADLGDATWTHRHYAAVPWAVAGGDFSATTSGTLAMPTSGPATFPSQPGMVTDVQSWLDAPAGNFGWIISGNEGVLKNARSFSSKEGGAPPSLRIVYTAPPTPPPAVPDGATGSPVLLSKLSANGANLGVSWDTALCNGDVDHHIVYGTGSGWPDAPADPYVLAGSVCDLGGTSPFAWNGSPDPAVLDPATRLLWMLVLADDGGTTEGSWGRSAPPQERKGPGANGCSAQCGIVDKSLVNTCGNGF